MAEKKIRSANFSNEEKLQCLSVIKKYKHIIECKETGNTTWRKKQETWKLIENEINASCGTFRSAEVLKRFYNNRKKETRKIAANVRRELGGTGGGPSTSKDLTCDPIYNLTLDIINKKSVFGLENAFDGDGEHTAVNEECVNIEDTIIEFEDEHSDASVPNETFVYEPMNWQSHTPNMLQRPITANIKVAKKQQTPRRRQPVTKNENVALKYEEVADLKRRNMELQFEVLTAQKNQIAAQVEFAKKEHEQLTQQREEQFTLSKRALQLDIELKEAQLKALQGIRN